MRTSASTLRWAKLVVPLHCSVACVYTFVPQAPLKAPTLACGCARAAPAHQHHMHRILLITRLRAVCAGCPGLWPCTDAESRSLIAAYRNTDAAVKLIAHRTNKALSIGQVYTLKMLTPLRPRDCTTVTRNAGYCITHIHPVQPTASASEPCP